jgi:hypothetical protein
MSQIAQEVPEVNVKNQLETFRQAIKVTADTLRRWQLDKQGKCPGEIGANMMLAYRHLEDASMRLGKAIQAHDGGISVYDKTKVPESIGTGNVNG